MLLLAQHGDPSFFQICFAPRNSYPQSLVKFTNLCYNIPHKIATSCERQAAKEAVFGGLSMITGAIKNKVDKIWTDIWAGGITNPLTVIE